MLIAVRLLRRRWRSELRCRSDELASARHLRGHGPSKSRPSLSALRLPHGDHRGLRGGLSSAPPSLRTGANNRDQLVVTPLIVTFSDIVFPLPLVSAGNHGARPVPCFPTRFLAPSAHQPLKFASQRTPVASFRPNHSRRRLSQRPCAARSAPNKST